jgi:hypothetical protein
MTAPPFGHLVSDCRAKVVVVADVSFLFLGAGSGVSSLRACGFFGLAFLALAIGLAFCYASRCCGAVDCFLRRKLVVAG